uniref:Haloacid dehalogenase-like hydrolase domain-containing 5 n=1 Tax=Phallusia mammillata TaxID=59560 RepID=A0A6F9D894_9ASCI|nr:cat eye syndrome critical region protein 5 [Phallusia mammillata]
MSTAALHKVSRTCLNSFKTSLIYTSSSKLHYGSVKEPNFGLLFDIDGVLIRGKKAIPAAKKAFKQKLVNKDGKFRVPTVFVTNAGNALAQTKAEQLSTLLEVEITSEQVMMSHSPLRMFDEFHDKCVLLSGQGPVDKIAERIGFQNTITIDQIRSAFPNLDMVDHQRRPKLPPHAPSDTFPKIEAVVLFGEPVRWETNLQLIIDILLTHGSLSDPIVETTDKHLPVLACNMDLLWMSESHMPRFGHGTFMHCLESVYEKMVGKPLTYTALMGKPSEITYMYAEQLIRKQSARMGLSAPVKTLYAIGDNPMADIYGANLYNKRIKEQQELTQIQATSESGTVRSQPWRQVHAGIRSITTAATQNDPVTSQVQESHVESCHSVLVCTGVYSPQPGESPYQIPPVFHGPRDIEFDVNLCMPSYITKDANAALDVIFDLQKFPMTS